MPSIQSGESRVNKRPWRDLVVYHPHSPSQSHSQDD